MATIEKCSVCGASAAVRWKPGTGRARFLVWVECTECGTHTRQYMDGGQPAEDSPGGKWVILAWNSGEQNKPERRCKSMAEMTEAAREARRAYKREWNAKNRDKVKASQERYWERKARQAQDNADAQKAGERQA